MNEKKPLLVLQKIYELRKAKKISLAEMAEAFGVKSDAGASLIENGEVPLRADRLDSIAKLLGVNVWQLFIEEDSLGEAWPLNNDEKTLVSYFRKIPSKEKKQAVLHLAEVMHD